ncbi:phosphopantetheine-binding protein, partial [Actinosynnema sp. NPDC023658]|uniref:phosphopantetheine-binding protein n=1 Tax=Actinosynnema sp. NPDC023658 TaxID=3155465 RepID=UPI00340835D1
DSPVKVRAFRVELGEGDAAIRAVPGVDEAAAFPVRDRTGRVTGLVAAAKSDGVSEGDVLAAIGEVLPRYAVPRTVRVLPELPIGVTGKLDRKALERQLSEPTPRPGPVDVRPTSAEGYERIVAETWSSVLGVDLAVDADGNFFDVGGNSALLGSVFARLLQAFPDAGLQLVEMYRYPTIPALAARLRAGSSAARGTPVPPQSTGTGPARPGANRRAPLSAADRRRLARRVK